MKRRRNTTKALCAGWVALAITSVLACEQPEPLAPEIRPPETEVAPGLPPDASFNARPDIVAELRRDLAATRHPSDGGGAARWDWGGGEAPTLAAGESAKFPIVFTAGRHGIQEGGLLFLMVPPFWGWSGIALPGFTEVETSVPGLQLEPRVLDRQLLAVALRGRGLEAGEQVRLVYGAGAAGARVDRFAERDAPFQLAVDGDGDGVRRLLAEPLRVDIAAGPAARLVALVPSVVRPGEDVELRVAVLDAEGNAGGPLGRDPFHVLVASPQGFPELGPIQVGEDGVAVVAFRAPEAGGGRFQVQAAHEASMASASNPIQVDASAARPLWADLHGHSHLSDGTGTPDDFYRYARDVAALDVAALTDHDHWGLPFLDASPPAWQKVRDAVQRYHAPGRFVTLLGFEWTSWLYGHRHVLYFDGDGEVISSLDEATDHPQELWNALRGREALTFAHHPAGDPIAVAWEIRPDPVLEPVTEIVSVHGSSEMARTPGPVRGGREGSFTVDALARGYRLGFVGSGDSHDGHPGLTHLASGSGGLAAIFAEDRTRASVLAALRARRSYATNGPRILLHVRLDGHPMGSAVAAGSEHRFEIEVAGTGPIEAIDVIQGGELVASFEGKGELALAVETSLKDPPPGSYAYVRIRQRDGGAAWSSPFFFTAD
ncbi:MAG: CehA/McbA family metallohydrolase [Deltaproteobacteria bacterium]|nr:CehA/McbA family metallohydrolase [Deltaproteobacteria bacterium]